MLNGRFIKRADGLYTNEHGLVYSNYLNSADELWFIDNKLHREDGPATLTYFANSTLICKEEWWVNGNYHRDYGPAYIRYDFANLYEEWHIHGTDITNKVRQWIKYNDLEYNHWTEWDDNIWVMFKLKFVS